jgi:hypothetical protein
MLSGDLITILLYDDHQNIIIILKKSVRMDLI